MNVDWRAVGYGFITAVVLGLLSGVAIPYTNLSLPILSSTIIGLLGGLVAGYVGLNGMRVGALNGALATAVGSIVGVVILTVLGLFVSGVVGLGILALGVVVVLSHMIPGAIGGAAGAWLSGRRATHDAGHVAPR